MIRHHPLRELLHLRRRALLKGQLAHLHLGQPSLSGFGRERLVGRRDGGHGSRSQKRHRYRSNVAGVAHYAFLLETAPPHFDGSWKMVTLQIRRCSKDAAPAKATGEGLKEPVAGKVTAKPNVLPA